MSLHSTTKSNQFKQYKNSGHNTIKLKTLLKTHKYKK